MSVPRPNKGGLRYYGRYNQTPEDITRCVASVSVKGLQFGHSRQCTRKRGPDGLYCQQHSPAATQKRRDKADAIWKARIDAMGHKADRLNGYSVALDEVAKYLSPHNQNVADGDLVAAIRDLAQIAQSAKDNVEDLNRLLARGEYVLVLTEAEREALELLIASGCAIDGPVRMDLRPTLLGIRERLLTDAQKRAREVGLQSTSR